MRAELTAPLLDAAGIDAPRSTFYPPYRWLGGKAKSWRRVLHYIPRPWPRALIAPFVGGAQIEARLAAQGVRVWGSDLDPDLVHLWQLTLTRPHYVAEVIRALFPLPAPEEFKEVIRAMEAGDDDERAIALAIRMRANIYGRVRGGVSLTIRTGDAPGEECYRRTLSPRYVQAIEQFRSPTLSVDHLDYRAALERHPELPAYLDPPYYDMHDDDYHDTSSLDYDDLARRLLTRNAPWAMSCNDCEWIRDTFTGQRIELIQTQYSLGCHVSDFGVRRVFDVLVLGGGW